MGKIRRQPVIIGSISRRIPAKTRANDKVKPYGISPMAGPRRLKPRRMPRLLMDRTVARVEEEQGS